MSFNELNSVEHYIIQQLTGVNLNTSNNVQEKGQDYQTLSWKYTSADSLKREITEVLVETELKDALIRLNPEIAILPDRADEVIHKLRTIIISVNQVGLVRANEDFAKWLKGEMTMPFGKDGQHVGIRLIDFDKPVNNSYIVTNQFKIRTRETKIPDIVMLINGIPVIIGEAKTPVRPAVSWLDGAHEIHAIYENATPNLFVPNILSFATEGKELRYGAVRTPLEFWGPWRIDGEKDLSYYFGLNSVGEELNSLLHPLVVLDMLQYFSIYATNNKKRKIKIISRYQQYLGANAIIERVKEGRIKKGLIWHFQGSGKSLLMVFAAQKLRKLQELKSPTVIIVVDRIDLDSQISGTFTASDIPNLVSADSINELHDLLEKDTRKIIITMVHKFKDAYENMNTRDNIIMMVDEAHRTQEGNLGRKMRSALPNAFLFGLTGTPVNRADKNTFWAFGAEEDTAGYMSRYTFQDSIRDKQTLPLHFEPRLPNVHIDKESIDTAFNELTNELTEEDKNTLSQKAARMSLFLKSPERIATIVTDIVKHYRDHVEPQGFKAMIVAPDRLACTQYKEELDKHMPASASAVVMSTSANDDFDFKQKWGMDKDKQDKIVEEFNDTNTALQFIIVTAKLLTGFDAPILQTMYLDKSLKDHTLLQAICRTNRLFPNKSFGRIVDYFGVFDDTAKALEFDEETIKKVITNFGDLKELLPEYMEKALLHFKDCDRTIDGFEGLQLAQECIKTVENKDAFAADYVPLSKIWESLSPDPVLNPYNKDYIWLTQVYTSVKPVTDDHGRLLWMALGEQTTRLIHENIHVDGINEDMEKMELNAEVIDDLMQNQDPRKTKTVIEILSFRLRKGGDDPVFKKLSQRLEEVRLRAEQGLISSIEFIKQLCEIARETVQAERDVFTPQERKSGTAALTELFLELKTDKTPAVVERIVNDIDAIVRLVRFDGWQTTVAGEREVQKSLRKTLLKYQLHKEEELFEKAYGYIKEYY
ncbi:HsdR family type I site-specific deoxyribonuclease [soil metagenome]